MEEAERVNALVEGLRKGTVSAEDVDARERSPSADAQAGSQASARQARSPADLDKPTCEDARERARAWYVELQRRQRAREKLHSYLQQHSESHDRRAVAPIDYAKWELWEPSEDEDDPDWVRQSQCSGGAAAIERDVVERRNRQVQRRQGAYRARARGNDLLRDGQVSAALKEYESGLELDKRSVELHSNAAKAYSALGSHVQAIEHCDSALQIADFFLEQPTHPVALKALTRRAYARTKLGQLNEASRDLEHALENRCQRQEQCTAVQAQLRHVNDLLAAQAAEPPLSSSSSVDGMRERGAEAEGSTAGSHAHHIGASGDATQRELRYLFDRLEAKLNNATEGDDFEAPGHAHEVEQLAQKLSGLSSEQATFYSSGMLDGLIENKCAAFAGSQEQAWLVRCATSELRAARTHAASFEPFCQQLWRAASEQQLLLLHELCSDEHPRELCASALARAEDHSSVVSALAAQIPQSPLVASTLANVTLAETGQKALCVVDVTTRALQAFASASAPTNTKQSAAHLLANAGRSPKMRPLVASSHASERRLQVLIEHACGRGDNECASDALAALANCAIDESVREMAAETVPSAARELVMLATASQPADADRAGRAMIAASRLARAQRAREPFRENDGQTMKRLLQAMQDGNNDLAEGASGTLAALLKSGIQKEHMSLHGLGAAIATCLRNVKSESARGNAALMASTLSTDETGREELWQESGVSLLLDETRRQSSAAGRKNAAIALAKLSSADKRFLHELRHLGGVELIYQHVHPSAG